MKCYGRSQEAKVTWGWGVWAGERILVIPLPFCFCRASTWCRPGRPGRNCVHGAPGEEGDSVGKGMGWGKSEVWPGQQAAVLLGCVELRDGS